MKTYDDDRSTGRIYVIFLFDCKTFFSFVVRKKVTDIQASKNILRLIVWFHKKSKNVQVNEFCGMRYISGNKGENK